MIRLQRRVGRAPSRSVAAGRCRGAAAPVRRFAVVRSPNDRFRSTIDKDHSNVIDLYTWSTPNGRKVSIALEELELEYETHRSTSVPTSSSTPTTCRYPRTTRSPPSWTGRAECPDGIRSDSRLPRPKDREAPARAGHPALAGPGMADVADGRRRSGARAGAPLREVQSRCERVCGEALPDRSGPALRCDERPAPGQSLSRGDEYSIADIATWPWVSRYEWQQIDFADFPNVRRWYVDIAGRPAVQRGYHVPKKTNDIPIPE